MLRINRKFILASTSPRRLHLLRQVGIEPEVVPSEVEENNGNDLPPRELALDLAERKARNVAEKIDDGLIVGADTIVVIDDVILGKPSGKEEAAEMLRTLSGRTHKVITAFCLVEKPTGISVIDSEETDVSFNELSSQEIEDYVNSGKPLDKAGAYGIQDFSALFVRKIDGCYNNVVGFPLARFYRALKSPEISTFAFMETSPSTVNVLSIPIRPFMVKSPEFTNE